MGAPPNRETAAMLTGGLSEAANLLMAAPSSMMNPAGDSALDKIVTRKNTFEAQQARLAASAQDAERARLERADLDLRRQIGRGRASTILTGPVNSMGVSSARKTLLGM